MVVSHLKLFQLLFILLLLVACSARGSFSTQAPPNIIYVLADDLGWNDVSFHGSPQIPTPNIDALASAGIVLHNYYAAPQCTPSRASLMTGRYPSSTGLQHVVLQAGQPDGLPLSFKILPQYLKDLGYSTAIVGKWHLGYCTKQYTPLQRGFDKFFGYYNGYLDYFDYTHYSEYKNRTYYGTDLHDGENDLRNFRGQYATVAFTDKAVSIVEQHNTTKPLFLYMSHLAVHTGNPFATFQALPPDVAKFKYIEDIKRRIYAGQIARLDKSVGQLFRALNNKEMLNNSIIIFSSDNGGPTYHSKFHAAASNWPLRGQKMQLWEGGVRVPALVWSPLLRLQEPRTSEMMMHVSDWLPTLYFAAGGDVEDLGKIDGMNMWPHLLYNMPSPRVEVLLNIDQVYGMAALRQNEYKIINGSYPGEPDIWYGPSGRGEVNLHGTLDEWVWKNGSEVRDILMKNGWWLVTEPDHWRANLTVQCLKTNGSACDPDIAPCLFNVVEDPCEYDNIADRYPMMVENLIEKIHAYKISAMEPLHNDTDPKSDPLCHGFAHAPWLDDNTQSDCSSYI